MRNPNDEWIEKQAENYVRRQLAEHGIDESQIKTIEMMRPKLLKSITNGIANWMEHQSRPIYGVDDSHLRN